MDYQTTAKSARMLEIYSHLANGEILNKAELATRYNVTERSIQRDIESLRQFASEQVPPRDIVYDAREKGFRLAYTKSESLSNAEILAVCKILLESRSMRRDEMVPLLNKLIRCCIPEENRRIVKDLAENEMFHYIEPHHNKPLLSILWEIGQAIQTHQIIEITYTKLKENTTVCREVEPVGLLFSEYYFYLAGFIRDIDGQAGFTNPNDIFPTIYRVDRIRSLKITEQHFKRPYKDRFEEGEFRKRVQFMYSGRLRRVRFRYTGPSVEAVLDRLPTAQIISRDEKGFIVDAEVYGDGIFMWLRSQGNYISVISDEKEKC